MLRNLLKKHGFVPTRIATAKLRSYQAAIRESFLFVITTRAFELTIGQRVPISRFVAENGRYSALNHWDQLSVSSRSSSLCTTPSMSNIIFSVEKFQRLRTMVFDTWSKAVMAA